MDRRECNSRLFPRSYLLELSHFVANVMGIRRWLPWLLARLCKVQSQDVSATAYYCFWLVQ